MPRVQAATCACTCAANAKSKIVTEKSVEVEGRNIIKSVQSVVSLVVKGSTRNRKWKKERDKFVGRRRGATNNQTRKRVGHPVVELEPCVAAWEPVDTTVIDKQRDSRRRFCITLYHQVSAASNLTANTTLCSCY